MKVLCGDMEFLTALPGYTQLCVIKKLEAVLNVGKDFDLESVHERHDSYVIPASYEGEIVFASGAFDTLTSLVSK